MWRTGVRPGSAKKPKRCEMNMETRVAGEPISDVKCLVRTVVIHHQMNVSSRGTDASMMRSNIRNSLLRDGVDTTAQ
jgi:hypothetical protein